MRRQAELDLLKWYKRKDRMPLVLRGARQVGKSTLVSLFCESNKISLLEINFELAKLRSIHKDPLNLDDVLDEIQLLSGKKITPDTLIFLDEIQEEPKLIQVLRYFYEKKPHLAIIAAGSLLEITIQEGEFSFPVGRVEFYHLGPMTFFEFLVACGQEQLKDSLSSLRFSESVYSLGEEYFKKYLYIGGMPKAVLRYVEEKSLISVRQVQNQILQTYMADFPKYSKRVNVSRLTRVFQSSPLMVGKKVVYQNFDSESKTREIKKSLELLFDARVLLPCFHTEASGIPLEATKDERTFKFFFLDVGLLNSLLRLDFEYFDLKENINFISKGVIAEQFVAQHLNLFDGPTLPPNLNYWLREKGSQKGEIDFLLQKKSKIIPVEVKAAKGGHLKSLFYFAKEKGWDHAIRLALSPLAKEKIKHRIGENDIHILLETLPIYAVEALGNI